MPPTHDLPFLTIFSPVDKLYIHTFRQRMGCGLVGIHVKPQPKARIGKRAWRPFGAVARSCLGFPLLHLPWFEGVSMVDLDKMWLLMRVGNWNRQWCGGAAWLVWVFLAWKEIGKVGQLLLHLNTWKWFSPIFSTFPSNLSHLRIFVQTVSTIQHFKWWF